MLNESDSMSTKTGLAPRREMAPAVAKKVNGTVMTSSAALSPDAINAKSSASLPEAQPIARRLPTYCAVAFSNSDSEAHALEFPREEFTSEPVPPGGTLEHVFTGRAGLNPFRQLGTTAFYPEVVITFTVEGDEHFHVPLLLNPYGYSTYRGS